VENHINPLNAELNPIRHLLALAGVHHFVDIRIRIKARPQMTIWRMRVVCCMPKSTSTHSEYVILIAFPLQQWLYERDSLLRYTYIGSIVEANYISNNVLVYAFHVSRIELY
jgi:hypothetical protein